MLNTTRKSVKAAAVAAVLALTLTQTGSGSGIFALPPTGVTPGTYGVFVTVPHDDNRSTHASYTVKEGATVLATYAVDQSAIDANTADMADSHSPVERRCPSWSHSWESAPIATFT